MSKASVLVLSALGLSAAILALTWTLGGPAELAIDDDLATPSFRTPTGLIDPGDGQRSPVQRVERAEFRSESADGRVQVFSFAAIEPRSNFVSDFTEPRAELYLTNGRLVVIEAASGTFLHPGNDPQRGSFDRDVVVTLHQAPDDASLDPTDTTQIVMRLFLDDATSFDRDEGRIITPGPVELTGPAAAFTGRGLNLIYSAAEERIANMTVAAGEELRLHRRQTETTTYPPAASPADANATNTPDAKPEPALARSTPTAPSALDPNTPPAESPPASPPNPPTYYQARFERDVLVRVGQDEANLTGEALEVVFAFAKDDTPSETRASTASPASVLAQGPHPSDLEPNTATDAAPALPVPPTRSLFIPRDDDVRITWAGPLTLRPLDAPPALLHDPREPATQALNPDDALLTLLGSPARIVVPDPDRHQPDTEITADALAYATATGRLDATGQEHRPFRLDHPAHGTLTGQRLLLRPDQPEHQADIRGPGRLTAYANPQRTDDQATHATPPLDVQFAQRLRLRFTPRPDSAARKPSDPLAALGQLSSANFQGNVQATARPNTRDDSATDQPAPRDEPLGLTAEVLVIDFAPGPSDDDASPILRTLTARQHVLATHAGRSLAADALLAEFAPLSPNDDDDDPPVLRTVTATGAVTALLPDPDQPDLPPTTLTAHRLIATPDARDPAAGSLLLLAEDNQPVSARITTPAASLTGPRLELNQADQSLHAQGPGRLTQTQNDQALTVAFQNSLIYRGQDHPFPTADALGQVVATSATPTQAARLEAHRLALTFNPHPANANPSPSPETRSNHGPDETPPSPPLANLQLRTAHATPHPDNHTDTVTLTAQNHAAGQPDAPESRLTLVGPDILLTAADDTSPHAQITGQGQMYLEDYGNPDKPEATPRDATTPLELAGQGVTLFTWNDRLHLDLLTNDLTMHGRVGMNHNPLNDQPNVQLVADRLRADLTEDPPFVQMLRNTSDASPRDATAEPTLRGVQLDGRVIVQQLQRKVFADQLLFTAADRNVLLQAQPGNAVRAVDESDRRANLEADAILWNLDSDRLRITDYRGGLVPIE